MQRGRILIVVAAATAAAALLFPVFTAPTIGDLPDAVHLLPFFGLVVAAAVAVAGDRGESLTGLPAVAAAGAIAGAVMVTGALFIDATIADSDAASLGLETSLGTGLWLTTIAVVTAVVGVAIAMSRRLS